LAKALLSHSNIVDCSTREAAAEDPQKYRSLSGGTFSNSFFVEMQQ
jgi:hypothetical protein